MSTSKTACTLYLICTSCSSWIAHEKAFISWIFQRPASAANADTARTSQQEERQIRAAGNDVNVLRNIIILYTTIYIRLCGGTEAREHAKCPAAGAAEHQIPLPRKEARTNCINTKRPPVRPSVRPPAGLLGHALLLNVDRGRKVFSVNRGRRPATIIGAPAVVRPLQSLHLHPRI